MNVLSIDGGGIRGIIPAMVLAEIEELTERPISQCFDLIAGTSTGGLIALALSLDSGNGQPKYTAQEVVQLYENRGTEIFDLNMWRKIRTGKGLIEETYTNTGLRKILEEYFGNSTLKDTLTEVIIPAYETEQRKPWFFKSINAKNPKKRNRNYRLVDVALATSAAPTYFEAHKVEYRGNDYLSLIDGGLFANNPALCAYIDAKSKFGKKDNEINLVSLGTGQYTRRLMHDEIIDWGLIGWAKPVLSCVFDGLSDTVDYQLSKILDPNQYFRFQKELTSGSDDMDNVEEENLRMLKLEGREIVNNNKDSIDKIKEIICKKNGK